MGREQRRGLAQTQVVKSWEENLGYEQSRDQVRGGTLVPWR